MEEALFCMDRTLAIYVSSIDDGSVSEGGGKMGPNERRNQCAILAKHGKSAEDAILVRVSYEETDFCKYVIADAPMNGDGMSRQSTFVADGVVTSAVGTVLFLPLADCIGAVLYDKKQHIVMLSHLGRQNLEQQGGFHSVEFLRQKFQSQPRDIDVFLSPSVGKSTYPLYGFDGKSLKEVACEQLSAAGVEHIAIDERDTATSKDLFSHSQFLKGRRLTNGRHTMLCYLESRQ